jgi:hypothetical protein
MIEFMLTIYFLAGSVIGALFIALEDYSLPEAVAVAFLWPVAIVAGTVMLVVKKSRERS